MSIYAIGDVQGCYEKLQQLLHEITFDASKDKLYFVGDLVNRGPQSLETLRFIKSLGDAAVAVLGNHDIHLLAIAYAGRSQNADDTIADILSADDCDELLTWLRHLPLLFHDEHLNLTLCHAGVFPLWSLTQAQQYAHEVEAALQGDNYAEFLAGLYSNQPVCWSEDLTGIERLRFIVNAFTRMRYVTTEGCLELNTKVPPQDKPASLISWYQFPERPMQHQKIVFGHWAALQGDSGDAYAINVDAGCIWGKRLVGLPFN